MSLYEVPGEDRNTPWKDNILLKAQMRFSGLQSNFFQNNSAKNKHKTNFFLLERTMVCFFLQKRRLLDSLASKNEEAEMVKLLKTIRHDLDKNNRK